MTYSVSDNQSALADEASRLCALIASTMTRLCEVYDHCSKVREELDPVGMEILPHSMDETAYSWAVLSEKLKAQR